MEELETTASSSDRHPAVTKGQEDLAGVKSVQIKRNFKKNSDDEFVVTQSTRTEMIYESAEKARDAYINIYDAKDEAEFEDNEKKMDKIDPMEDEETKPEIGSMTEQEEKSALDARKKADTAAKISKKATPALSEFISSSVEKLGTLESFVSGLDTVIANTLSHVNETQDTGTKKQNLALLSKHLQDLLAFAYTISETVSMSYRIYGGQVSKEDGDTFTDILQRCKLAADTIREKSEDVLKSMDTLIESEDADHVTSDWDNNLMVQAYVPGATGVSDEKNPGPVSFGYQAKNQKGLENYTKWNGNTMPEHQYQTNKPFGYDQTEQQVEASAEAPNALLQKDFKVSPMEHELKMGVNRELEHTDQPAAATEIALDHLAEDPDYYTKLNQVMPESGPEEKKERVVYVNPHDKAVEDFDYEKVGKETMFPGVK